MEIKLNLAREDEDVPTTKSNAQTTFGCIGGAIALPALGLWFYLLYQVLVRVDANAAMWAAYWTYMPLSLIVNIVGFLGKIMDGGWHSK